MLGSSRKLEGAAEHLIGSSEKRISGCGLHIIERNSNYMCGFSKFIRTCLFCFFCSFVCSFVFSFVRSFVCSLVRLFVRSFVRSVGRSVDLSVDLSFVCSFERFVE